VELDPQNFNSTISVGSFMKRPANIQRLSTILHRPLKLASDKTSVLVARGATYFHMNQLDQALSDLTQAIQPKFLSCNGLLLSRAG